MGKIIKGMHKEYYDIHKTYRFRSDILKMYWAIDLIKIKSKWDSWYGAITSCVEGRPARRTYLDSCSSSMAGYCLDGMIKPAIVHALSTLDGLEYVSTTYQDGTVDMRPESVWWER